VVGGGVVGGTVGFGLGLAVVVGAGGGGGAAVVVGAAGTAYVTVIVSVLTLPAASVALTGIGLGPKTRVTGSDQLPLASATTGVPFTVSWVPGSVVPATVNAGLSTVAPSTPALTKIGGGVVSATTVLDVVAPTLVVNWGIGNVTTVRSCASLGLETTTATIDAIATSDAPSKKRGPVNVSAFNLGMFPSEAGGPTFALSAGGGRVLEGLERIRAENWLVTRPSLKLLSGQLPGDGTRGAQS
jgi:hypothetical protein